MPFRYDVSTNVTRPATPCRFAFSRATTSAAPDRSVATTAAWHLGRQRHGQDPAARSDVGEARRPKVAHERKGFLDDEFRLGARHEHGWRHEERPPPELARAENVRRRFARFAAGNPLGEAGFERPRRRL